MRLSKLIRRNLRDERGSFSVEAILMFPLLAWAFMAMYVFFEGLRESNINLKAAYTVSDLLSREHDELITDDYMNGMHTVFAWLTRTKNPVQMRVTVIRYEEDSDIHENYWSKGVGVPDLLQADISEVVSPHVPIMADESIAIVVETWASYDPILDMGLQDTNLYNIVVTAPRFAGELNYEGMGDGTGDVHDDGTGDGEDNTI